MARVAKLLTVRELAALRDVDVSTIRRQLHALDEKSRDGVICVRKSPRSPIKTTAAALKRADKALVEDEVPPEVRVQTLEKICRELKRALIEQKKQAAMMMAEIEKLSILAQSRAS